MTNNDTQEFGELVAAVYAFYNRSLTPIDLEIWWEAMKAFDFPAVRQAFSRHLVNTDSGQFLPKPADIVRMLGGSTQDAALIAWSKVDKAVRRVGPHKSVAFDDGLVHRVLEEMGGWVELCNAKDKDWPFKMNEFVNRYRSYRMRSESPAFQGVMLGIVDGHNMHEGWYTGPKDVVLIGDEHAAQQVMIRGVATPQLGLTRVAPARIAQLLEDKR